MQSIGNVWVEKYVIAKEQNVARSIEMYLSRTPAAITPLGLVGNPVLKAWLNGHMLTQHACVERALSLQQPFTI